MGRERPTIRDRVAQTAVRLELEPIFEADFQPCSYGFRPKKSAHQALDEVARYLARGYMRVLDADLTAYFDSIPDDQLLAAMARRVSDRHIVRLLRKWLRAPVVIERADGKREVQDGQRTRRGTPQGRSIFPVLANLYLHAFDTAWRVQGLGQRLQARLIRYTDDFVILCRQTAAQVQPLVTQQLQALGLTLNLAKTRVLDARQHSFTFLGFTVRVARNWRRGTWFPLAQPSAAACQELRDAVKALTGRDRARRPTPDIITEVNRIVQGCAGYSYFRHCTATFCALNQFVGDRVRIYLRRKHQYRISGYRPFPDSVLYGRYGLYRLPLTAPWKAPASA